MKYVFENDQLNRDNKACDDCYVNKTETGLISDKIKKCRFIKTFNY